jgi:uncharacterized protein YebE (UPF0316 family)
MLAYSEVVTWVIIPVLIFLARIIDVTIGTARVIFVSRGYKMLAAAAGFFEVLIWLLAMGQIMKNLSNPFCYIAYASGFSLGNFIGITLAEKMSLGTVLIQVMTNHDPSNLVNSLIEKDYGVTTVQGQGAFKPVKLVFTIVPRRHLGRVLQIIREFNPASFYSIHEIATTGKGFIPPPQKYGIFRINTFFKPFRKGK